MQVKLYPVKRRRLFRINPSCWIEVFWHYGREEWGTEWRGGGDYWATGYGATPRKAFQDLRVNRAKALNPNIVKVFSRLGGK